MGRRYPPHPLGAGFVYEDKFSNPWGCQTGATCGLCGERYQLRLVKVAGEWVFRCRLREMCGWGWRKKGPHGPSRKGPPKQARVMPASGGA